MESRMTISRKGAFKNQTSILFHYLDDARKKKIREMANTAEKFCKIVA